MLPITLMFDGQVSVGNSASITVTVNEHILVLSAVSDAEQVTVVTPFWKLVPLIGLHVTGRIPSQLSLAVGVGKETSAVHAPGSVD